jgi:DNA/RNA-binding domain of Phe-tRNA-synthetase-like protein
LRFSYGDSIREDFPELVTGLLAVERITGHGDVSASTAAFLDIGRARLRWSTEANLPEVQAWRRAFARMGLKPTQHRCASEALLRRFRKYGSVPGIHPLVDLCNAVSIAFGVPIAVFDRARLSGDLEVRRATGDEIYDTFGGEVERPEVGEVIFADSSGRAHARRWTSRQSSHSAVRDETEAVLIVCEAMHESAVEDVARMTAAIEAAVRKAWPLATVAQSPSP